MPSVSTTSAVSADAGVRNTRAGVGVAELAFAMVLSGTIGFFVVESDAAPQTVALARCLIGGVVLGLWCLARGYLGLGRLDDRLHRLPRRASTRRTGCRPVGHPPRTPDRGDPAPARERRQDVLPAASALTRTQEPA